MKRKINFRPILFCFIFLWLGIIFCKSVFNNDYKYIIFLVTALACAFLLCLKYKILKRFLLCLVCLVLGFGFFFIGTGCYYPSYSAGTHIVIGRVAQVDSSIILKDVKVDNRPAKNLIVNGHYFVEIGDYIIFESELEKVNLFNLGRLRSFYYRNNITHSAYIENCETLYNQKSIDERVKYKASKVLNSYLDNDTNKIAYAMLFGETSNIDDETIQAYRDSGIAHMLAVSGLHIGFLCAIIIFILNKLKLNRYIVFIIISSFLLFYCFICGFSPSVVRASLMMIFLQLAGLFGKKYDGLNAISLSGILILLVKPLYAFDIGFQLSFLCVFSIFLLCNTFNDLLTKIKLPKPLALSASVCLCTLIGILPIQINIFKQLSILSVFTNLICIPIFQLAFTLLVVLIFPVLIFNLGFLLFPSSALISLITLIAKTISNLDFATISLGGNHFIVSILYLLSIFLISGLVFLSRKTKAKLSLIMIATLVVFGLLTNINNLSTTNIYAISSYSSNSFVITTEKDLIAISFDDGESLYDFLCINNVRNVTEYIAFSQADYQDINIKNYNNLSLNLQKMQKNYKITNIMTNTRYTSLKLEVCNRIILFNYLERDEWENVDFLNQNIHADIVIDLTQRAIILNENDTTKLGNFTINLESDKLERGSID